MKILENLALEWVKLNYTYNKYFKNKEVDCVVSKNYGSVAFYFVDEEDERQYINWKKSKYLEYCQENLDDSEKEFSKRKFYPYFITELFITSEMAGAMLDGKNLKKIK